MNRSAEFTLSLIATIFLTIGWLFTSVFATILGFVSGYDDSSFFWFSYLLIYSILTIPLLVLIWIATFKIKNNSKGWGIFLLVMGILYTISVYFVPGVLLLIAGIMMVAKKNNKKDIELSA